MHDGGSHNDPDIGRTHAFLSLGSNLGDRANVVRDAVRALDDEDDLRLVCVSSLYETEPTDLEDQPWYINAVVEVATSQTARALLESTKAVEERFGRRRTVRFGPRILDIDILLYGRECIDEPGLTVPHPRMTERRFVLVPLLEIAPDLDDPRDGVPFHETLERLDEGKKVTKSAIIEY